jgi:tetratricopeptide (TPR) repeat protein
MAKGLQLLLLLPAIAAAPLHAQGQSQSAGERACQLAAEADRPARSAIRRCSEALGKRDVPPPVRLAMLMNRGIAWLRADQPRRAADDFDLAIRAAPSLPESWINKGLALMRMEGRAEEAIALISHGIELGPAAPARAYFARAQAQEIAGKLRAAMEDYAAAARADPDWPAPAEELKRFRVERRKVLRG